MIFSSQYANRADRNIHILKDTLEILKKRKYYKDGSAIRIKLSRKQMEECHVYLPEDIKENRKFSPVINGSGQRTLVSCRNIDSFSAAEELYRDSSVDKILVLNFANPFNPGGGVRTEQRHRKKIYVEEVLCFYHLKVMRRVSTIDIIGHWVAGLVLMQLF